MTNLLEKPTDKQLTRKNNFTIDNLPYLDMKLLFECKQELQLRYNRQVTLKDTVNHIFMKALRSKSI